MKVAQEVSFNTAARLLDKQVIFTKNREKSKPIKYSWMLLKFKFNHYLSKQLPWIKNCHKSSFHALRWRMYQIIKKLFWITGWRAWWISANVFFNTWLVKHLTVLIIVSLWSFFNKSKFQHCLQTMTFTVMYICPKNVKIKNSTKNVLCE